MNIRVSRLGLSVLKFRTSSQSLYLMRLNPKWRDVNFIGGHEKDRDAASLQRTAQRELWEEVPSVRSYRSTEFAALTDIINYGPVLSKSRGDKVKYEIQFFLLTLSSSPRTLVTELSYRSRNVWLRPEELTSQSRYRVSALVSVLQDSFPGGLDAIPFTSTEDLSYLQNRLYAPRPQQLELALK